MQKIFYFPIFASVHLQSYIIICIQLPFSFANEIRNGYEILVPNNYEATPANVTSVFNFIMQGNEWLQLSLMLLVI